MAYQCPHCDSHNNPEALHCDQCGGRLDLAPAIGKRSPAIPGSSWFLLALALGVLLWAGRDLLSPDPFPPDPVAREVGQAPGSSREELEDSSVAPEGPAFTAGSPSSSPAPSGWVSFRDRWSRELGRVPAGMARGGWLALPRIAAIGSSSWHFRPGVVGETVIEEGVWRPGEPVGVWRVRVEPISDAPPLRRWDPARPVELLPLAGGAGGPRPVEIPEPLRQRGFLLHASAFEGTLPGLLRQGATIVGWVIGPRAPGLWLWDGPDGESLRAERTVTSFHHSVFVGGREELLVEVTAPGISALERLHSLSGAMTREKRLTDEEIPVTARRETVGEMAREALSNLVSIDAGPLAFDALSSAALAWLDDPGVLAQWCAIALELPNSARASAIATAEDLRRSMRADPQETARIEGILRRLWIAAVLEARATSDAGSVGAWLADARARYPEDGELIILECEWHLDASRWRAAEVLIGEWLPVPSQEERAREILARIRDQRLGDGRIVIEFSPGGGSIRTEVAVGSISGVPFIIDTGATFTSVPSSLVTSLGITIGPETPRRWVHTASDVIEVPVVILPPILIQGWAVEGIEATVIDLPETAGTGLLGLDFLSSFRVNLDSERGLLILEPR